MPPTVQVIAHISAECPMAGLQAFVEALIGIAETQGITLDSAEVRVIFPVGTSPVVSPRPSPPPVSS